MIYGIFIYFIENVAHISNALERLTDPQTQYNLPSLSKVTKAMTDTRRRLSARSQQESPIPVNVLNKILMVIKLYSDLSHCMPLSHGVKQYAIHNVQ